MGPSTSTDVAVRTTLSSVKSKGLLSDEKARVVALLKRLVDEAGSQAELSRLMKKRGSTATQQTISAALSDGDFGIDFARAVAEYAHIKNPLAWIEGGDEGSKPVLGNLPGFHTAMLDAKKREPFFPPFAWDDATATSPLIVPPRVDAEMLIFAARLAISLRNASELEAAEGERIDAEEAERNERQIEGEQRVREAAARGEKLSLTKAMSQLRHERAEKDREAARAADLKK